MHLPLFSNCNSSLVTELANRMEQGTYGRKQVVVEEGAVGSSLLLVRRGSLLMSIDGENVTSIGAKKHFGETNLLAVDTHWKATLTAEVSTEVCLLSRSDLLQALEAYPIETRTFENIRANHDTMACMWGGTIENRCELFDGLSEKTLWAIDAKMVRRLIFQGDKVLSEGEAGDELYLLVQGRVDIVIAGRVVRQASAGDDGGMQTMPLKGEKRNQRPHSVCMFGELGLLGMQEKRSFSVVARTTCQVRVLYRSMLLRILEQRQETLHRMPQFLRKHYNEKQKSVATMEMLRQVPPFCDTECGEDFLQFLLEHLEDAVFLPGQTILDAEASAHEHSRCYFLGEGAAKVLEVSGFNQLEKHVGPGAVIGDLILVATVQDTRRTVIATDMCYLQALHQSVLVRGLELFPQERSHMLQAALGHMAQEGDDARGRRVSSIGANFKEAVKTTPLFLNTSQEFVDELSSQAATRIYLPSDNIIEQGREGNSMFILVTGQANVIVQDGMMESIDIKPVEGGEAESEAVQWREAKVGSLGPGSVFGELTMLGISPTRSATIRAETVCFLWEITQDTALLTIEKHPDAMKHFGDIVVHNLERTVQTRILGMPLFQSFDCKFRTLLSLYCERSVYFPRQRIVREGQVDERMIVVNVGRASLEKKGLMLRVYTQGTCFGAALMLGLEKAYHGSLIVMQTCHILSVTRRSYLQALDRYPSTAAAQELKRVEQEQAEEFRRAVKQAHVKRKAWKSCEGAAEAESVDKLVRVQGVMKGWLQKTNTSIEDWLHSVLQAWCTSAQQIRERRDAKENERQKCLEQQNRWLQRQVAGRKHREEVQKLQVEKDPNRSALSSLASSTTRLPQVPPKSARTARLEALKTDWPQPRKSPYYNLRFWCVLADAEAELPAIRNGGAQKATERTPRNEA